MNGFDHERISALLNIVEKCAGHSGKLGALSNMAMSELLEANEQIRERAIKAKTDIEARLAQKKTVVDEHDDYPTDAAEEEDANFVKPPTYPAGSNTATIADNKARRL